jgi:hypothetical protein
MDDFMILDGLGIELLELGSWQASEERLEWDIG